MRPAPAVRGSARSLPVDARSIGPELLQPVILAGLGVEDVDHEVAVILHDPARRLVALDRTALVIDTSELSAEILNQLADDSRQILVKTFPDSAYVKGPPPKQWWKFW